MLVIFDVRGQQCKECFTDELVIMNYGTGILASNGLKIKTLMMDLFHRNAVVWILVNYRDVFISCLDSHSDGAHSHASGSKLCIATVLQINF